MCEQITYNYKQFWIVLTSQPRTSECYHFGFRCSASGSCAGCQIITQESFWHPMLVGYWFTQFLQVVENTSLSITFKFSHSDNAVTNNVDNVDHTVITISYFSSSKNRWAENVYNIFVKHQNIGHDAPHVREEMAWLLPGSAQIDFIEIRTSAFYEHPRCIADQM